MQVRENGNKLQTKSNTIQKYLIWQKKLKSCENTESSKPQAVNIVTYTEEETEAFRNDMEAKNTKKSTATAVRRFRCW